MNNFFKNEGNISIISVAAIFIILFFCLLLCDFCRLFVARSITKNASDAAVLAAAQNLLFMEYDETADIAINIALQNNCSLLYIHADYDELTVAVEKEVRFLFADKIGFHKGNVVSVSSAKIIYPWDIRFDLCKRYKFDYGF